MDRKVVLRTECHIAVTVQLQNFTEENHEKPQSGQPASEILVWKEIIRTNLPTHCECACVRQIKN